MAHPRQKQRRGGLRLLVAVLLVLLSLCLARLDAEAASAASPEWRLLGLGAATVQEKVVGQEAARGRHTATTTEAEEEEGWPATVPERVEMEVINDYPQIGANNRHNPHP